MRLIIQVIECHCRSLTRRTGGFLLLAATAVLFVFSANGNPPEAQTAATAGADAFSQADTNHDGQLSREEASDFIVIEIFVARDANHDGRMTLEEWVGGDPDRSADFKKRDANHDEIVTLEEAITYERTQGVVNEVMQKADTNHDGVLSRAEMKAYYASREGPPK